MGTGSFSVGRWVSSRLTSSAQTAGRPTPPAALRRCPPGRRVPEDTWGYERGLTEEPAYKLDALVLSFEVNTCLTRCCKTKAVVAVGLRYDLLGKPEEPGRFDTDKQVIDERGLLAPTRTGALDDLAGSVIAVGDVPDIRVRRRRKEN